MEDYYKILEVQKNASQDEIKKAYRKLAFKYHPDRNHGNAQAEENFKKINEAYSVLGDEAKRAAYDSPSFESQWNAYQNYRAQNQSQWNAYGGSTGDPFEDFFNFGRQYTYQRNNNYQRRQTQKPTRKTVKSMLIQNLVQCAGSAVGFFFLGRYFFFMNLIFLVSFIHGASSILSCIKFLLDKKNG